MMDPEAINEVVQRITELGYDQQTAERYAVAIGDTPEIDMNGMVVVRAEGGLILDRVPQSVCGL